MNAIEKLEKEVKLLLEDKLYDELVEVANRLALLKELDIITENIHQSIIKEDKEAYRENLQYLKDIQ